jgi:hypothetical protein
MSQVEQDKKKRYFQYGIWMLITGIILWILAGYILKMELFGYIGFILLGVGVVVLLTNRT